MSHALPFIPCDSHMINSPKHIVTDVLVLAQVGDLGTSDLPHPSAHPPWYYPDVTVKVKGQGQRLQLTAVVAH